MAVQVSLSVNDKPIELDDFVQEFISHTASGMIPALKGTGEIRSLDVFVQRDEVRLDLNGAEIPVNLFVTKIIKSTITGMVSSLKGVGEVNKINISIRR